MALHRLKPEAREILTPLYSDRETLNAIVDCVLEGPLGHAVTDDPGNPRVARLDLGCYSIFGGDATVPEAADLAREPKAPVELIFPNSDRWRELLHRVHPGELVERPMTAFASDRLRVDRLRELSSPTSDDFELTPLELPEATQLGDELEPHGLQVFESPQNLVDHGFGFCLTHRGRVVSQSTTYAISSRFAEQSIGTRPEFRKLGLARRVAARFLLESLERGLVPHWNASNPISIHLAATLGYRPAGTCEVLYLADASPGPASGSTVSK